MKTYSEFTAGDMLLSYVLDEAYTEPVTDAPTEPAEKRHITSSAP